MLNVEDLFISLDVSELPSLEKVYRVAHKHSILPPGFNPLTFDQLAPGDELFTARQTLDAPPEEELILEREYSLSLRKKERKAERRRKAALKRNRIVRKLQKSLNYLPFKRAQGSPAVVHETRAGHVSFLNRRERMPDLIETVAELIGEKCHLQGDYLYPRGGFRTWHTNKYDANGWRLYIIDVEEPHESFFRIKHPRTGEIYTHWDKPGTFNFFCLDSDRLMWHCIRSYNTHRWSKGFVIPDDWRKRLGV